MVDRYFVPSENQRLLQLHYVFENNCFLCFLEFLYIFCLIIVY